ncbi:TPA: HNH endonuclease, partial [Escherichia coli]|nr:HNH endonuclease [Escherichia coli]
LFEGKTLNPLVYDLDTDRLAARWADFIGAE